MALGNKILLNSEFTDTSQEQKRIKNNVQGIKKIKPKFAPGMRFPCQE